jgi:transcription initiation factor IIE alpha subunit
MKPWNPHRRQVADQRRAIERSSVLAEIRRRDCTAKELARRCELSLFQVRRALRALRREMLVTWLPDRSRLPRHAYTRVYLASSRAPRGRKAKAIAGAWSRRATG